jgi:hypothetical protein
MGKAIFQVVIGLVMLIGGLTGKLALRHTGSTAWMAVIGGGLTLYGVYRVIVVRRGG